MFGSWLLSALAGEEGEGEGLLLVEGINAAKNKTLILHRFAAGPPSPASGRRAIRHKPPNWPIARSRRIPATAIYGLTGRGLQLAEAMR
jgi:hypothetical protein